MGRLFLIDLEGAIYRCRLCNSHLGIADDILSKAFHSRNGKAYLFDRIVNVTLGEREDRMMITGLHTVVDIFCVGCGLLVGWKYFHILGQPSPKLNLLQEVAFEDDQKYKEGKFILERFQVIGPYGNDVQLAQDPQFLPDLEDIEDA